MKHVIVTGATGNLGRATVKRLLADGHHVIVTARPGSPDADPADDRVETHLLDLTDEASAQGFVDSVASRHGTIDAALLLAGGYDGGMIGDTTTDRIRKMISLNFDTAYHIARPAFNRMVTQKEGGRIIFIGARPALSPQDGRRNIAYGLSKSMLLKLADMLNAAGADRGVISSVIVPSTIDTPANREAMPKADFGLWVKPDEIADTIAFLISDSARSLREPVMKMYGRA